MLGMFIVVRCTPLSSDSLILSNRELIELTILELNLDQISLIISSGQKMKAISSNELLTWPIIHLPVLSAIAAVVFASTTRH